MTPASFRPRVLRWPGPERLVRGPGNYIALLPATCYQGRRVRSRHRTSRPQSRQHDRASTPPGTTITSGRPVKADQAGSRWPVAGAGDQRPALRSRDDELTAPAGQCPFPFYPRSRLAYPGASRLRKLSKQRKSVSQFTKPATVSGGRRAAACAVSSHSAGTGITQRTRAGQPAAGRGAAGVPQSCRGGGSLPRRRAAREAGDAEHAPPGGDDRTGASQASAVSAKAPPARPGRGGHRGRGPGQGGAGIRPSI